MTTGHRTSSYLDVVRLHLVDRLTAIVLPLGVLAFTFAINVVIFAMVPDGSGRYTGALLVLPCFTVVVGTTMITRSFAFALSLGASRRSYFWGSAALAIALGFGQAVLITVLNALERATDGWGIHLYFFRIPWLLEGAWYQVLLTSWIALALSFVLGIWIGLIHRRWGLAGVLVMSAGIVVVLVGAALVITWRSWWPAVGRFLGGFDVTGVSVVLLAIAIVLGFFGLGTIRRMTV